MIILETGWAVEAPGRGGKEEGEILRPTEDERSGLSENHDGAGIYRRCMAGVDRGIMPGWHV